MAQCPACGVVLAKVPQTVGPRRKRRDDPNLPAPIQGAGSGTARPSGALTPRRRRWVLRDADHPAALRLWRLPLALAFTLWGVWLIRMDHRDGEIAASFLHRPLLIFHEAGHLIFMPLGEWMAVFGGTLAQLLMPAIMAAALWMKNADRFGAALGVWLLGVSLLDIAPYVYDALHPQLMLLGGRTGEDGGHDWIYLLSSMGLLHRAHAIGAWVRGLGAVVVIAASVWAVREALLLEIESRPVED